MTDAEHLKQAIALYREAADTGNERARTAAYIHLRNVVTGIRARRQEQSK